MNRPFGLKIYFLVYNLGTCGSYFLMYTHMKGFPTLNLVSYLSSITVKITLVIKKTQGKKYFVFFSTAARRGHQPSQI
jgi:hypothetical protein